ncbi:MAG: stage V sporulation protein AC [Oscillospiraceae bacterium]
MKLNGEQYKKIYQSEMPKSNFLLDGACAFAVGGIICMIGQFCLNTYMTIDGMDKETAALLSSATLIALSAVLTGLGVYDKISSFAGAGTLVPITGFANAVVSPALEFKSEGYILGTGAKMFIIAGPVIVYGIAASVVAGLISLLFG